MHKGIKINQTHPISNESIAFDFNYSFSDKSGWEVSNDNSDKAIFIEITDDTESVCMSIGTNQARIIAEWLNKASDLIEDKDYGEYLGLKEKFGSLDIIRYTELAKKYE